MSLRMLLARLFARPRSVDAVKRDADEVIGEMHRQADDVRRDEHKLRTRITAHQLGDMLRERRIYHEAQRAEDLIRREAR